ncbi:hypothetical protein [Micromonospora sp. NPDC001898]|uniref:hypothetical protein n=1 Tax=Micromonospora sp. NPDC001898 TaxID=3364221 RepID=UPI0036A34BF1
MLGSRKTSAFISSASRLDTPAKYCWPGVQLNYSPLRLGAANYSFNRLDLTKMYDWHSA